MDKTLKQLANDAHTLSDFREFQLAVIKEEAGEMAMRGEGTLFVKDAVSFINKTFNKSEELYKLQENVSAPINEAR